MHENELRRIGDIGEFLTDKIVWFARSPEYEDWKANEDRAFRDTFARLAQSLGDKSFKKYDAENGSHSGGFLISAFEPIALGVGFNCENYGSAGVSEAIAKESRKLWSNPDFLNNSGMGVNASTRIPANVPLGRRVFALCE